MIRLYIICFIMFPVMSAYGQDVVGFVDVCAQIQSQYQSTEGAEYISGVDIHGKKVVPADLSSSNSKFLRDPIVIPIQIDLVEKFGLSMPTEITLEPTAANIKIYSDGRIQYNSEDISDKLHEICANQKNNENNNVQEHGHKPSDPVISSDKIEGQYPDNGAPVKPYYNE